MTSVVALIEAAIVQQLNAVGRPGGLIVKAESYGGQLDDELFGWVRNLPAVWVTFDAITESTRKGRRLFKKRGTFEVFTAQRNLQQDARRLNDAAKGRDVGVYELVDQNQTALVNQKLGLQIQPITPGTVRSVMKGVFNSQAVAVLAQSFSTEWMEEVPEETIAPDGTLVNIGLDYFIKPGDDVVDTSDVLTTKTL